MLKLIDTHAEMSPQAIELHNFLKTTVTGLLYIGFPLVRIQAQVRAVDALLISPEVGVVAFIFTTDKDLLRESDTPTELDDLYFSVRQRLESNSKLRSKKELLFSLDAYYFLPEDISSRVAHVITRYSREDLTEDKKGVQDSLIPEIQSTLESLISLKSPANNGVIKDPKTLGEKLRWIDQQVKFLDEAQRRATIIKTLGPERIRGLAGSGKTIVLALRASLLHVQHPEKDIAITFYTKSLYQQYKSLITRFCYSYDVEPDWSKVRLLHAWGGSFKQGYYSLVANNLSVAPARFDRSSGRDPFDLVVTNILPKVIAIGDEAQLFDAVFIDEAQDFSKSFFELVFLTTREPKSIVYAYDELQDLGENPMLHPAQLFGSDANNNPRVNKPRDTTLPVCYRNSPFVLTAAHAVGFGIYREGGLVQMFPEKSLWEAVGYAIVNGEFVAGKTVSLQRAPNSSPKHMAEMFPDHREVLNFQAFDTPERQAESCAAEIERLLTSENVKPEDILVIFPNAFTANSDSAFVLSELANREIPAHIVSSRGTDDRVFVEGSIAITNAYRAKGNESPVVFVLNSERCASDYKLITNRNMLFTSMTRSKAVVYVWGIGSEMSKLCTELKNVIENNFTMTFRVPTDEELRKMRQPHGELAPEVVDSITTAIQAEKEVYKQYKKGLIDFGAVSEEQRKYLERFRKGSEN